jgi:putative ABC transport system permease protein
LIVAVTLAVAALTAVGFFADRLKGGLQRDARQLLGGDAVVASDNPTPPRFVERARALGLQHGETWAFRPWGAPPTRRAAPASWWPSRRAAGLPAARQLRWPMQPGDAGRTTRDIPAPGEGLGRCPLLDALGLKMGDRCCWAMPACALPHHRQRARPGAGFMSFAPRVMLNQADVAATGLVQPASRLTYRLAVAATPPGARSSWPGPPRGQKARGARRAASSRWKAAAPRCARRWTAPRNS